MNIYEVKTVTPDGHVKETWTLEATCYKEACRLAEDDPRTKAAGVDDYTITEVT